MVIGMLPDNMELRPLTEADVSAVLEIIRQTDEEDFESAREAYQEGLLDGQYVLTEDGKTKGVTGFEYIDGTDNSYWLTRSCLDTQLRSQGFEAPMILELLNILNESGARKVFVNTVDSVDCKRSAKYTGERECYQSLAFILELNYNDYFQPGESRLTYGRRVGSLYASRPTFEPDTRGVELLGIAEIDQTQGGYFGEWDYTDGGTIFTVEDLSNMIGKASSAGARYLFVGFPSNLPQVDEVLQEAGFRECGRLIDFYEDGIDEVHYRIDL
ncbi:MAG: hypothetical protein AB1473_00515 [Thermodesulfobacteriota bacterium]